MFSKLKTVLTSDTDSIEEVKVENAKKNFLEQEYVKRKKLFKLTIFGIWFMVVLVFSFLYLKYQDQVKVFQKRVYVSIFGFQMNPKDYKISWFNKLSWWGQTLFLKDVKALAEANKYNESRFKKLVKQYQKMWKDFIKTKNLEKFKKEYAKFWWIEDLVLMDTRRWNQTMSAANNKQVNNDKQINSKNWKIINKWKVNTTGWIMNDISSGNVESTLTWDIWTWLVWTWDIGSWNIVSTGLVSSSLDLTWQVLSWNVISWLFLSWTSLSWEILTGISITWNTLSWDNLTGSILSWVELTSNNFTGMNQTWNILSWEKWK